MKHKNITKLTIIGLTILFLAASIVVVIGFPGTAHVEAKAGTETAVQTIVNLPPMQIKTTHEGEEGDLKIESVLNRLLKIYRNEGEKAAGEFAALRKIPIKDNDVKVVLDVQPHFSASERQGQIPRWKESAKTREIAIKQAASRVRSRIEGLGGQVEKSYNYMIRCNIDIQSLRELAQIPQVRSIRLPIKPHLHVISEGVQLSGANLYHDLPPFKSGGVKVCVLDAGFKHYQDLLGVELPETVTVRSFTDSGDIEADEVHGTACAEIVHDMAPDAELYLANIYWDSDVQDAVNWAIQQEVDIISYSLGSYWGAGDGTGYMDFFARQAKNAGILWATSAGNSANDHWSGTFNDPDEDGWHNFSGDDEILDFYVPAQMGIDWGVEATLKWYDWGTWNDQTGYSGSHQDYDLYLYVWDADTNQWEEVEKSENRQPWYKWPFEYTNLWYSMDDTYWGVAIRKNQATKNVFFDLYIPTHSKGTLEYLVPEGSITYPADSPNIIAVGAIDAVEGFYHYYSSQGPTIDGRIKPDIAAPSWVSTSGYAYGPRLTEGFAGTSAACPHVAGAIALLKGKTPFTLDQILQIIYARAIDMTYPGPDNITGWGQLNLRPR
ncbi:MAG: S8 family serine peptidase [Candidatus Aminicenantes bacterium]|nr:S8 family serine peptidase [Candidatus Aminicenantes bacterium]NIM78173.1 S8 family serine peptidase [Candidatus Aminicenantes bacterium]NIN17509.1 S8 family serine peptidase [Candidatus Aminicenantes bacterium]NIN41395.1 S8 family serine peptidase [Candidatus Aminicenantes bacterium]NIN84161.1 S8 family serine peptidase [Candidatus Aminicenantes bacterium]